ncbi:B12-binding domain-containing radical SAM protein [Litorilituus lipolyticus]|uniref:B12-binding domain-containing radical SAM protein n=1 Tax=Litorilituus lipolyticus TaxID=2491017 RepID=A0A502KVD8_9GAMM|nr:radical SAM protein [Litorilituus lipolyticus]TPH15720.1 B12-binding domain-containing radical SAM protein [Litorilituus lipolyticus]
MKIYLIKASAGSDYSKYKAETGGPPQNIFAAAAATPKHYKLEMADETIGMKTNFSSDADVVVIFASTPDAYRAYEISAKFAELGKTIILGGLHTKFNQEEAAEHAHALILGEVENYWQTLLNDVQENNLQPVYQSTTPLDLSELNPYPTNLISPKTYNYTWSVVVTRGCPFKCDFCLVHQFFNKFQMRPIENIVEELWHLKSLGVEWVELHSDNLTYNRDYAIELFKAIAPIGLKFYGETTVLIARDEEMLQAAKQAGVKALLLGIETPSLEALKAQKKGFVKPDKMKAYMENIRKYDIEVWGDFLFGFDEHTPSIFQETLDFVKDIKVDKVISHFMIPFPGSESFKKLDAENRILTKNWSKYDGSHSVYQPKNMSTEELEQGVYWVWKKTASFTERLKYLF